MGPRGASNPTGAERTSGPSRGLPEESRLGDGATLPVLLAEGGIGEFDAQLGEGRARRLRDLDGAGGELLAERFQDPHSDGIGPAGPEAGRDGDGLVLRAEEPAHRRDRQRLDDDRDQLEVGPPRGDGAGVLHLGGHPRRIERALAEHDDAGARRRDLVADR